MRGFLIAASLLALGLTGCSSNTVNTVEIGQDGRYSWVQTDSSLNNIAQVTSVNKARVDGLLKVQVNVVNATSSRRTIQWRIVWLDADGMVVQTPLTTWKREFLEGRQQVSLGGVAPEARVTDCRLEMQRADD